MKKIFSLLFILTVLLSGCTAVPVDAPETDVVSVETTEEVHEEIYEPEPVSITLSAVGDCTLASDIHYAGKDSFVRTYDDLSGDTTYFLQNVRHIFEDDDLTIVNFEGTLSENGTRENKEYAFRGKPEFVNILTYASVEAASLANNHSYDYGEDAFWDTGKILSDNDITWFEGANVAIREIKGIKIGLIGANLLEKKEKQAFLQNLEYLNSQNPDLVIVSFHWGVEKSSKPNKTQKEFAYLAIDNGADLVIGHHPHVLQGIEQYNGKYILYSLGNFCFGGNRHPSEKDTAIFRQTFTFLESQLVSADNPYIIPCSVSSHAKHNNFQPTPVYDEDFERIREKITKRSEDFTGLENIMFIQG